VVNAKNNGLIYILARSGNQYPFCACREMLFGTDAISKKSGALQRNVNAIGCVRQIGRITLCGHMNTLPVNDDIIAIGFNRAWEWAVDAIAFEQKSIGLGWCKIVNRDQFQIMVVTL
jgi:hypothetical protein